MEVDPAEELLAIAALGAAAPPTGPQEVDADALLAIAALDVGPRPAQPVRRSAREHCLEMVVARSKKRRVAEQTAEEAKQKHLELKLHAAALVCPRLRGLTGLAQLANTRPAKTMLVTSLALKPPPPSGEDKPHHRAAYLLGAALSTKQFQAVEDLFVPAGEDGAEEAAAATDETCVMISWMYDETKQWTRNKLRCRTVEVTTAMKTAIEIMVGHGKVHRWTTSPAGSTTHLMQPYFPRALQLHGQTTAFMWDAMKKHMPIEVSASTGMLRDLAAIHGDMLLSWTVDRAITNFTCLKIAFDQIEQGAPDNVIPHAELCCAHGLSLAKGRSPGLKDVQTASSGFIRLIKQGKNMDGIARRVESLAIETCTVVVGPPGDELVAMRKAQPEQ